MFLIHKLLTASKGEKKEAKDFFPVLLIIIIISGSLLLLATFLAKK
jgi:hypothetical protein